MLFETAQETANAGAGFALEIWNARERKFVGRGE